jgi:phosphatidylinositol alpha-1,6-mannosyltransferase
MVSGHGRYFSGLFGNATDTVVLVPKVKGNVNDLPHVHRLFLFSGKSGGPWKIYSILQHAEIIVRPLLGCLFSAAGWPRLVIASQPLFTGVTALIFYYLKKIPFIVVGHGEELSLAAKEVSWFRLRYRLMNLVFKNASTIICNSKNTAAIVHDSYAVPAEKLHVIYPTVDIDEQNVDTHAVQSLREKLVGNSRMVLMVGRVLETRKGFDKSIEALKYVLQTGLDVKLVIAGPGDSKHLEALSGNAGLRSHVIFTGSVERDELMRLFAACDLFLLPARTMGDGNLEGFGIVYLEANLMGKPVIGGRTGGTMEAVSDSESGLIVDGNEEHEIAAAIVRILTDPELAEKLGQNGRQRVLDRFTTEYQCAEFSKIIDKYLARG